MSKQRGPVETAESLLSTMLVMREQLTRADEREEALRAEVTTLRQRVRELEAMHASDLKIAADMVETAKEVDAVAEARGYARGLEAAREVVTKRRAYFKELIANGKGEWPKPGYVRDDVWLEWQTNVRACSSLLDALATTPDKEPK